MKRGLIPLLPLLVAGGGPCGGTTPPLPSADVCDQATTPRVPLSVEIGGPEEPFVPWSDGAVTRLIRGRQALNMVAVRARLTGAADLPACVRVMVTVKKADLVYGARSADLATYADAAGGRATKPLYVILFDGGTGDEVQVEASVAGLGLTRRVYLNQQPMSCDELRRAARAVGGAGPDPRDRLRRPARLPGRWPRFRRRLCVRPGARNRRLRPGRTCPGLCRLGGLLPRAAVR